MKKLFRSTTDNKLTGLCGGIAQYLNIDSTVVRLLVVLAALFSFGTIVFIYFAATLLVPKEPFDHIHFSNHYNY